MTQNPFDYNALSREIRTLRDMLRANPARHTSVDRGQFIMRDGSELLIEGLLTVIGRLILQGDMEVTSGGSITVGGVVITPLGGGRIQIGAGIVLDAATQTISVGGGQIVINAATGQITVGTAMTLQASESGGAVVFDSGAKITSDHSGNGVEMSSTGGWALSIGSNGYALRSASGAPMVSGTNDGLALVAATVLMPLLPTIPRASANNAVVGTVWADTSGKMYRVVT